MSDRLEFDIDCPNNHNQTVTFSREEFEEALTSGALVFHCNTCDTDWPPSSEEIADLRRQFSLRNLDPLVSLFPESSWRSTPSL
jgi:hypothetical protein